MLTKTHTDNRHLIFGFTLIVASFVYWFIPGRPHLTLFNALFYVGNILFFDALSHNFSGFSLLKIKDRRRHFIILGLCFGLLLEFYGNWIGRFWYYPHWDITYYAVIFIPGYAIYSFYLLETYLGTKAVLEHFFKKKQSRFKEAGWDKWFTALGLGAAAGIGAITTWVIATLPKGAGFWDAFLIYKQRQGNFDNWYLFALIALLIWLLLEFLEYKKHETSLLYELIRGNFWPLAALLLAAFVSTVLYEVFNLPGGLWRYAYGNVPFENIKLLSFPILVYVGWPLHYLWAFSLYRLLFKKDTENLWT